MKFVNVIPPNMVVIGFDMVWPIPKWLLKMSTHHLPPGHQCLIRIGGSHGSMTAMKEPRCCRLRSFSLLLTWPMSKAVYLGGNLAVGFAREAMKTFPSVYMHVYIYVLYYVYTIYYDILYALLVKVYTYQNFPDGWKWGYRIPEFIAMSWSTRGFKPSGFGKLLGVP